MNLHKKNGHGYHQTYLKAHTKGPPVRRTCRDLTFKPTSDHWETKGNTKRDEIKLRSRFNSLRSEHAVGSNAANSVVHPADVWLNRLHGRLFVNDRRLAAMSQARLPHPFLKFSSAIEGVCDCTYTHSRRETQVERLDTFDEP